jgi:phenylalanyl-tRNA synthetase beta chain
MLVPLSWLKEYVDIELSAPELAITLTKSGTAVERTHQIGLGLDDLIVAKAVEVAKHPNADRLKVAQVDTGSGVVEVVCGAPNLEAGQHIVFARPRATVPIDMHNPERTSFVLTEATIRGVVSHGMICSTAEMGLGEDHAGILVLPESTTIGQSINDALGYPQTVFDIEVTTNRADELAMMGLAREVSVLTSKPLMNPSTEGSKNSSKGSTGQATNNLTVHIESEACFRLMAQQLTVKVAPSPWWMQQYLSLSGMRPINNVVDITNFVMLEYGQPLHAYDLSKLNGATLIARQASEGETTVTLDGVTRQLKSSMLVIADRKKAIGIAGIMGGQASMIEESSTEIILEAAVFDAVPIRRAANALALRSEASKRFERQVDAAMTPIALQRAVDLLIEYASAKPVGEAQDVYKKRPIEKTYLLSQRKLDQYMGKHLPLTEAAKILEALGFKKASRDGESESLSFVVPSWRIRDVEGEEDLIEEVVRIVGYDQLPIVLPSGLLPDQLINQQFMAVTKTKELLARLNWTEVITTSLTSLEIQQRAGLSKPSVGLTNPLSSEWTHMRESLVPGLLEVAQKNVKSRPQLQLFELSSVYLWQANALPAQQLRLSLLLSQKQPLEASVAALKGSVEAVLGQLVSLRGLAYRPAQSSPAPFDPSSAAQIICDNQPIGWIGSLLSAVQDAFNVPAETLVVELAIESLLQRPQVKPFQALPLYPSVEEDISLVMEEGMEVGQASKTIYQAGGPLVESVELVNIYRHESLGESKKSPLLHIAFRSADHSLASNELADVRLQIIQQLEKEEIQVRV